MASQNSYQKLPDLRSIRVIKLHGATNIDDAIHFDLITASLDASPTSYEALSYTWGGQSLVQVVYANGKEFLVTENARNAMRRLRPYKPGNFREIWIDAICINQKDDDEKSNQVQMMFEIYARAKCVNIWLGEEDEYSALLFKWLRWTGAPFRPVFFVREKIELAMFFSTTQNRAQFFHFLLRSYDTLALWVLIFVVLGPLLPFRALPIFKDFKRKIKAGVDSVAAKQYWERSWTVQESSVNFNEFIICGSSKPLPVVSFYTGHFIVCGLYVFFGIERHYKGDRYRLHMPTYFFHGADAVTDKVLSSLCEMKATLPVDKIYAIRAMYPGSLGTLPVDYRRSEKGVFTDAARLMIKANKNVRLFRFACVETRADKFPTWVPAWDTPSVVPETLSKFMPAMVSPQPIIDQDSKTDVLKLKVLRVDTATINTSAVFPTRPPLQRMWAPAKVDYENPDETFEIFKAWAAASQYAPEVVNDIRPKLRQFASLMADMCNLKAEQIFEWFPMLWQFSDYGIGVRFGYLIAPPEAHVARQFTRYFLQLTSGRALFTTESGRVGMSTRVVCEGDEVVLLSGEQMPYLVRKCADRPGKYTLVSPCWISGAVKGEAWPVRSGDGVDDDFEYFELV